jgi:hypothetical protein
MSIRVTVGAAGSAVVVVEVDSVVMVGTSDSGASVGKGPR